jgi:hypothetical protein
LSKRFMMSTSCSSGEIAVVVEGKRAVAVSVSPGIL